VVAGEVPIRDFRAYDPGRYLLYGTWMRIFGTDLISMRRCTLVFRFAGISAAFGALWLGTGAWPPTLAGGALVTAWMYPPHRQIDLTGALTATFVAVLLATHPGPWTAFASGLFTGLMVLLGLNHGLYAGVGYLATLGVLGAHHVVGFTLFGWFAAGLGIGLLPMSLALLLCQGFFATYWEEKIRRIFRRGSTNLSLPIPWLWRTKPQHLKYIPRWVARLIQVAFTVMPLSLIPCVFGLSGLLDGSPTALALAGASALSFGYLHHAFSRADYQHLCQGAPPVIVTLGLALSTIHWGWIALALLAGLSFWRIHLPWESYPRAGPSPPLVYTNFGSLRLRLEPSDAALFHQIQMLVEDWTKPGDSVAFVPLHICMYPLLDRRPAIYDTFCVYPASKDEDARMIEQLSASGTRFVLVYEVDLDNRPDLRFSQTHPNTWAFLNQAFNHLDTRGILPPDHAVFVPVTPPQHSCF
jgi:hypothetical protein